MRVGVLEEQATPQDIISSGFQRSHIGSRVCELGGSASGIGHSAAGAGEIDPLRGNSAGSLTWV